MISWLIVRAGLPAHAGAIAITALGLLLGIFAQDFFESVFSLFGDFFRWLYYALPSSMIESSRETLGNGQILIQTTGLAQTLRDVTDFLKRPGDGLLIAMTMGFYWFVEIILLCLFLRTPQSKGSEKPT